MIRQVRTASWIPVPAVALVALLAGAGCTSETGDTTPAREGRTPSGLAYDISGSGPPIVLIHGAMLDRRQWQPQRALAEQFTVIAYDTRWHGQSAGADSAFSAADDLAAVIKANIVGLSNGAKIATDFAQQDPSREQPLTPPAISRLNEMRVPVLVITGDADMRDIILTGDTLERSIAGARRATISGAKHMLNITHATQFNALVAEFLAQPAKQ